MKNITSLQDGLCDMLCYKDRVWCTAKDCPDTMCNRNTKSEYFDPDDYWKDKIMYGDLAKNCEHYQEWKKKHEENNDR